MNRPPLDLLLFRSLRWDTLGADMFEVIIEIDMKLETFLVHENDLSQFHPDFPHAMRGLIRWATGGHELDCIPMWDRQPYDTRVLLMTGGIELTDLDGTTRTLSHVYEMKVEPEVSQVTLLVHALNIKTVDIAGHSIPFVTSHNVMYEDVTFREMDKCRPGWEERWRTSSELGADRVTILKHVFDPEQPQAQQVDFKNVSFDVM